MVFLPAACDQLLPSLPVRECGLKLRVVRIRGVVVGVTPRAGVWIEIPMAALWTSMWTSLPVRECGLKWDKRHHGAVHFGSLPVRECGLKLEKLDHLPAPALSLPVRECGLKCLVCPVVASVWPVTPRAGVWIEMLKNTQLLIPSGSLPVRECGLKYSRGGRSRQPATVTPRAGVWIEIPALAAAVRAAYRHSPCGSVD